MIIDGVSYSDEEIIQAAELFPYTWMLQHDIKTSNGLPFEFTDHAFMKAILNDMSPLQVILKPPQIGMTETMIVKKFYVAKKLRKDIIYTLPTATDVYDLVGGKENRIIAQNPILMGWVKDRDTIEQKWVGQNLIYNRGTFSTKQAMMVSSDLNIHDEVDASDPSVITQYETRLQAKADGWRWYFSHPSLAGHGVDIYWEQSDKKEWFITCPSCHEEQILSWPDSIDRASSRYVCQQCREALRNAVICGGHWKPTAAGIFSGYHISQMMCSWISAQKIIDAFNDPLKDKQYFFNYVLGLPYAASEDKISPATVLKNCVDETNDERNTVVIGVDPGLPIHVVCMNRDGVFYYETCENWRRLEELLDRWPRSIIVSDQGGDLTPQRELMERYPGRVFLCFYRKDKKSKEIITWGAEEEYGKVTVDRNRMISLMVGQLRDIGRIRLNGTPEEWSDFANHFGALYREKIVVKEQKDKDDRTLYGNEYVWKRSGPDHFAHALLYAMVGISRGTGQLAKTFDEDVFAGLKRGVMVGEGGIPAEAFRSALW